MNALEIIGLISGIAGVIGFIWFVCDRIKKWKSIPKPGAHTPDGARHNLDDPKYLLGIRADKRFGFDPYYYRRTYLDDVIYKRIDTFKSMLITGAPLAGKTRAVYEALKKFNPVPVVIMPSIKDVQDENYPDIENRPSGKRTILLFDDIHKYTVRESMANHLRRYQKNDVIIIATCRTGPEFERLCDSMTDHKDIFDDPIEIAKFKRDQAEEVADKTNRDIPDNFDGTIGSLFVPLQEIEETYGQTAPESKQLLFAIKRLYDAGVYDESEVFSLDHIRKVYAELEKVSMTEDEWQEIVRRLEQKRFYKKSGDTIQVEETVLQRIIPGSYDDPDDLKEISDVFKDDFDALNRIRSTAHNRGLVDIRKAAYQKVAIEICHVCLDLRSYESNPEDYAMTQNNLGNAYLTLGEVEEKAANCQKAIVAYENALQVRTRDRFPMDYAMTQFNLSIVYYILAQSNDKESYCAKAIRAVEESLKVYTKDALPLLHERATHNLNIYREFCRSE